MTTKSITTLVQDIYALLESGKAKLNAPRLADMISQRVVKDSGGDALRMSSLGEKCTRKLWYKQNKPEVAEPLPGNTLYNFLIGDIHDQIIPELAEQAGHTVEGRQTELNLHGVVGHRDCIIDGVLVDVKSANSRSVEKFERHALDRDDPFGYMDQLNAYLTASKDDPALKVKGEAAFLVVDKELGKLVLDRYVIKPRPWESIIAKLREALNGLAPPPRAYSDVEDGKSGNRVIPLPCRYCQYKTECWKDSNGGRGLRKFIYSTGPRWFSWLEKEPRESVKEER